MLTKETPLQIKTSLTIKSMGVENTLLLTFVNRKPDDYEAFMANQENFKYPETATTQIEIQRHMNASVALFLVQSFDDGTEQTFPLTKEGLIDLERYWPGTLLGIHKAYHQARGASVEKN